MKDINKNTYSVDVDSGMIMIVDPCYVMEEKEYVEMIERIAEHEENNGETVEAISVVGTDFGDGVVFHTPYGDGSYLVRIEYQEFNHPRNGSKYKKIKRVVIKMY